MQVGKDAGAPMSYRLQRLGRGSDDDVAGEQGIGLLGVDAHLMQPLRHIGQAHKAQYRPTLLCEAHEVEHAGAFALKMRRHGDHRANGDHASAAHAGYQQVVRGIPAMRRGQRQ